MDLPSKDKTALEKALKAHGEAIIKQSETQFFTHTDPISLEILKFQRKYGKKWFKHYTRAAQRLAAKEHERLARSHR